MAYLKKTTGQTQQENPQSSLVSQGGGALGSGATTSAPVAGATGSSSVPQERTASTPQYVSGQQYLEGNRAGAQKLAQQIVEPIKTQAADLEAAARQKSLQTIQSAQLGGMDEGLITRAAQDARALQEAEQQQVRDVLGGVYKGPTDVDFGEETTGIGRIGESAQRLETSEGIEQELGRMGTEGDRKYTTGMKAFDAMLMRQDPALRQQLQDQSGLSERVAGTIEEQRQAALAGIAQGQAGTQERAGQVRDYFGNVQSGQEQFWTDSLDKLRGVAGGVQQALTSESPLNAAQLKMIGLDQGAYDQMRDAYRATSYGRNRPLTYAENYNYQLNSPTQFTAANAYVPNAWENFQLDQYATGVNPNQIGYGNVVDQESLAKYQALLGLTGGQAAGYVPQAAGVGDLTENALNFNNVAAQQALAAFMKSGVAAPRSNLDVMEGAYGPGGYLGWNYTGAPRTPGYTKTGANIQTVDPLTGRDPDAMSYVGAKNAYGYATDAYNPAAYDYSGRNPVDQAMLNERAQRSGGGAAFDAGTYTPEQFALQQALANIQNT